MEGWELLSEMLNSFLANIALIDEKIVIFDCIEFNESLRWIDVISEIAFTSYR